MSMTYQERIFQRARIELARRDFYEFCRTQQPGFYKDETIRGYLKTLADTFQDFYENDDHDVLVVNMPPRTAKSLTASNFTKWALGRDPSLSIMTASYNQELSSSFSKSVRDAIMTEKADEDIIVYSDIFPETRLKDDEAAKMKWALEGHYNSYMATSPGGTATGFGADLLIVDDLIKSADEAFNMRVLNSHWRWFNDTMLSRLERGAKVFIIMTRWHEKDLAGRILDGHLSEFRVRSVIMPAQLPNGEMLCDDVLNEDEYRKKTVSLDPAIASANYQQKTLNVKGRLYSQGFQTYRTLPAPTEIDSIRAYIDTADTGKDFTAGFIYAVTHDKQAYVLDTIYTREPMEVTEPLTVRKLHNNAVKLATIESNNGGRGFARNVERGLMDMFGSNETVIQTFHQSKNKEARILTNATWLQRNVFFPDGWEHDWPALYHDLMNYERVGKNEHDDAQDALTGIAETINEGVRVQLFTGGI